MTDLMVVTRDNMLMVRTLSLERIDLRNVRGAFRRVLVALSMEVRDLSVQVRTSSTVLLIELIDLMIVTGDKRVTVRNFAILEFNC